VPSKRRVYLTVRRKSPAPKETLEWRNCFDRNQGISRLYEVRSCGGRSAAAWKTRSVTTATIHSSMRTAIRPAALIEPRRSASIRTKTHTQQFVAARLPTALSKVLAGPKSRGLGNLRVSGPSVWGPSQQPVPLLGFCSVTATRPTVQNSADGSRRWASPRSSLQRAHDPTVH